MKNAKILAEAYGISEDYAILLVAAGHRQPHTEDDFRECKYSHDLPKGVAEFVVISCARKAINERVDLQEIVDRLTSLDKTPQQQEVLDLNEMLKTHDLKFMTPTENRRHILEMGRVGFQILKHAAIYQKHILKDEYDGIYPRKLPEIIEQVNLVNQKAGK